MKTLLLALIGFSTILAVNCLTCYSCDSNVDKACIEEEPDEKFVKKCEELEKVCYLYMANITLDPNDLYVARGCGHIHPGPIRVEVQIKDPRTNKPIKDIRLEKSAIDTLRNPRLDNSPSEHHYSLCNEDNCNSGNGMTLTMTVFFGGLIVAVLVNRA